MSVTVTLSADPAPPFVIVSTKLTDVPDVTGFGVAVKATARSGSALFSALTDSLGRYRLALLPLGAYTVTVGTTSKTAVLTSAQPVTVNFP